MSTATSSRVSFLARLRRALAPTPKPARRRAREQRRPHAEPLEARIAPASLVSITKTVTITAGHMGASSASANDTLHYTVVIGNASGGAITAATLQDTLDANTSFVPGSIHISPIAQNDTYATYANTLLEVGVTPSGNISITGPNSGATYSGVLANDLTFNASGGTDTFSISANTTPAHGSLTFSQVNGTFSYEPTAGYVGDDTFTYTYKNNTNATLTDTGTVTIHVNATDGTQLATSQKLWYVNSSNTGTADGTSLHPFATLPAASVAGNGDLIYVATGTGAAYTGAFSLKSAQVLQGAGDALVVPPLSGTGNITLKAAGGTPVLSNTGGTVLTLNSGNTLDGFNLSDANTDITGSGFGTLTVSHVAINNTVANSTALSLTTGAAGGTGFTSVTAGKISLNGVTGTLHLGSGALSASAGDVFTVVGGSAAIDYSGTIANSVVAGNTIGHTVNISGATGGTITLSGQVTDIGTGITLANNTNATVDFTGGVIANTGVNKAFSATGGGTIDVTGSGNTLTTTTGTALDVESTTIGANGLTFKSISANGGANGIFLDTTGSSGGLTVTGTLGSTALDNSGGTIQNIVGADGTTAGDGIYLNATSRVSLNHMNIHNVQGDGIHGNAVSGLTLTYTNMSANGNTTAQLGNFHGEGDVNLVTLSGSATVDHNNFQSAYYNTFGVFNDVTPVSLNRITMTSNTFGANDSAAGNAGVVFRAVGGAMNVTFGGSTTTANTITGAGSNTFIMDLHGTVSADLIMKNNAISNNHPNIVTGGGGVSLQSGGVGDQVTFTFNVDSNQFSGSHGAGFFIGTGQLTSVNNFSGTFSNNTIGFQLTANSGSTTGNDLFLDDEGGLMNVNITGNKLYQYNPNGTGALQLQVANDNGHEAQATFLVTGNTISNPGANAAAQTYNGIQLNAGTTSGDTAKTNLTLYGNTVAGSGNASQGSADIRLRQRFNATVGLFGNGASYGGAPTDTTAVAAFAVQQNGGTGSAVAGPSGGFFGSARFLTFAPSPNNVPVTPTDTGSTSAGGTTSTGAGASSAGSSSTGSGASSGGGNTPPPVIVDNGVLSQAELSTLVQAAIHRWEATGLTHAQDVLLHHVTYDVENLDGLLLGLASPGHITLDSDAAGNGWYIDKTPLSDSEYQHPTPAVADHVDALTTIMHELGHQLGLADIYDTARNHDIMYGYLSLGTRHVPAVHEAKGVLPAPGQFLDAQTSPVTASFSLIPNGKSVTIVYDATVNAGPFAAGANNLVNNAQLSYSDANSVAQTPVSTSASIPLNAAPDFAITSYTDAGVTTVTPGSGATYTINYANQGNQNATGVFLTETLPAGATFVSAGSSAWVHGSGQTYTLSVGPLSATNGSNTGSAVFKYTVSNPAPDPTQTNNNSLVSTVAIDDDHANGPDTTANNSGTDTNTLNAFVDLSVTKSTTSTVVPTGGTISYNIAYANGGNQNTTGAIISDTLPTGTTFNSGASTTGWGTSDNVHYTYSIGNLAGGGAGNSVVFVVTVTASSGTINNTATITSAVPESVPNQGNNTSSASGVTIANDDLSITSSHSGSTVPGQTVTYTITATNSANSVDAASGATITDAFSSSLTNLTLVSAVGSNGAASNHSLGAFTGTFTDSGTALPKNSSIVYTITGTIKPSATGSLSNQASIAPPSGFTDSNTPNNTTPVDSFTLTPQADLQITKSDNLGGNSVGAVVGTAIPGNAITYTLVAKNTGPSDAPGSVIADTFSGKLSNVTYTAVLTSGTASGFTASGSGNISDTVSLGAGAIVTYTVHGTVTSASTGTLSNTATVTAAASVTDNTPGNNTATDNDNLTPQVDLQITKSDNLGGNSVGAVVGTAIPGNGITYTIVAKNTGPSDAPGSVIADPFSGKLSNVTYTAALTSGTASGFTASGSGPINDTVALGAGSIVTYTVHGTVTSASTGTLSNTATVTAAGSVTDTTPGNNTATDTDNLTPQVDLLINKFDNLGGTSVGAVVGTAIPGNAITYTLVARNAGPSDAPGSVIADTFSGKLSNVTYTASLTSGTASGFTSGSGPINDTVNLGSGATVTYTVHGTVTSASTGTLSNTATVTAAGSVTDTAPGNNTATDTDNLTPQADLQITKSDNLGGNSVGAMVGTAIPGTAITYTIVAKNTGPSDAPGSVIADPFSGKLSNVTYSAALTSGTASGFTSGSGPINDTVTLGSGATVTYTVHGTVTSGATGTLSNTATVTAAASVTDNTPGNNTATDTDNLTPQADLQIIKSDNLGGNSVGAVIGTAIPGTPITYTIVAKNTGPSDAPGSVIADPFSGKLSNVTYSAALTSGIASGFTSGSGPINDTVNLGAGSIVTYTVHGTVTSGATGTLSNTATVTAAASVTDNTPGNNTATDNDTLTPQVDLQITKSDNLGGNSVGAVVGTAIPGNAITYTIVAKNTGPSDAPGSVITDTFSGKLSNVTYTASLTSGTASGFTASGSGNISDTVTLGSGAIVTYTVHGTVGSGATGTLTNTATVTPAGSVTDTAPSNNTATDTDNLTPQADLQITKSDNLGGNSVGSVLGTAIPGNAITYTVVAKNVGPSDAPGSVIADTFSGKLSNVTYTASLTSGTASGFTASGSGSINDTVTLGAGSIVTYTVHGTVGSGATGTLTNTATVTAAGSVTDTAPSNNTATDTDNLTPQADLQISKSDNLGGNSVGSVLGTAIPGNAITYTLVAKNTGPSDAPGSVIADTFSSSLSNVTYTASLTSGTASGFTASGSGNINDTVSLGAGSIVTYTVHGTVKSSATGSLSNTATVTAAGSVTDTAPSNNTATDADNLTPQADLQLTKTGPTGSVTAGTDVNYTLHYVNAGPSDAVTISLVDTLPSGTTLTGYTATGWSESTDTNGNPTFTKSGLTSGESGDIFVTAHVSPSRAAGTITNTAQLTSATSEVNSQDNTSSAMTNIQTIADLAVKKTANPTVLPNQDLVYSIHVDNNGASDAQSATLSDTLPAGTVFVSDTAASGWSTQAPMPGSNGTLTFNTTSMASGAGADFTITVHTTASSGGTVLSNTATVSSNTTDNTPGNNSSTVVTNVQGVDLSVTKDDNLTSPVTPGQLLTYTLTYTNHGYVTATGVALNEVVPANTVFDAAHSTTGWGIADGAAAGTAASLAISSLDVGAGSSATFAVRVLGTVSAGAEQISNTATITDDGSHGNDITASDNTSTHQDTLNAAPDLKLSSTQNLPTLNGQPYEVAQGGAITYTLTYSNVGNQDATGVVLSEHLPANSTAGFNPGWTHISGDLYQYTVGNLAADRDAAQTATFTVQVNHPFPAAAKSLSESASIADDGTNGSDLNPANNPTQLTTPVYKGIYAVATGVTYPNTGPIGTVVVYDVNTGNELTSFEPYGAKYRDSIRIATGDFNGDGFDDIVTSTRTGTGAVEVFNGLTGAPIKIGTQTVLNVFDGRHQIGAYVAVGDVTGDGHPDIVVGSGIGSGLVKIFNGATGALVNSYAPFDTKTHHFTGGVRVAVTPSEAKVFAPFAPSPAFAVPTGNVVAVTDYGAGAVKEYQGSTSNVLLAFTAGGRGYTGGLSVAVGDLNHDGIADIIVGSNVGRPFVQEFDGSTGAQIGKTLFPFGANGVPSGARVAAADINGDGIADIIVGSGAAAGAQVRIFDGSTNGLIDAFSPFPKSPSIAVFVAATTQVSAPDVF